MPKGENPLESSKILSDYDRLLAALAERKAAGRKIVFTNGCFDILHLGHVTYLQAARAMGDALVVGLNSDVSVRAIKGPLRPITPQNERAGVLAGLSCVDFVTFFDEPDPFNLISRIVPDVLVKGSDWPVDQIIGADVVLAAGGRVENADLVGNVSTTGIIERILERYRPGGSRDAR